MSFLRLVAICSICVAGLAHAEEPPPVDQEALNALAAKDMSAAFLEAFEAGDELTEAVFTTARGVGARVTDGQRFTRYPRADLTNRGDWATHEPAREGGPQAQSCITCHAAPLANGAGGVALNVAVDPLQSGNPAEYLERNTLHLFALGAVQRVAEEITLDLLDTADAVKAEACAEGEAVARPLTSKGIEYGRIGAEPSGRGAACVARLDTSEVRGVDEDLVVRMFGWKGTHATIRAFSRGAAHNEMGMQADELVGAKDGDHDGVTGELSVGDMTAMATYIAGLERPTSKVELADHGLLDLPREERAKIAVGEQQFGTIGCAGCHMPRLALDDAVFAEPSQTPGFYDAVLPSGQTPESVGLTPASAIQFDLTAEQPNNHVIKPDGAEINLGAFETDTHGRAIVRWYSDFRRHDMGPALADPVDAFGFGASVWPTRSLAGVGSTGPWLHNGHATTLDEAILAHGGEAEVSRDAYAALSGDNRAAVIAFLENLIIADLDAEEGEEEH